MKNMQQFVGLQKKDVVVANTMIRAAQGLSLAEKRILFSAIAKMGGKFGDVQITAREYAETFGLPDNQAYEQLKEASKNFFDRYFTVQPVDRKHGMVWHHHWLSSYGYEDGLGYVKISFNHNIFPYLCDLEKQFTKYQLKQASSLRSIYSWRLLELFEQMKDKKDGSGWLTISIEDFWFAMEATATHKRSFAETRRKIVEPAIKELCDKDGWLISWRAVKAGRKIVQLKFNFTRDPQGRLF